MTVGAKKSALTGALSIKHYRETMLLRGSLCYYPFVAF